MNIPNYGSNESIGQTPPKLIFTSKQNYITMVTS